MKIVTITPEMAEKMLSKNNSNRKMSSTKVKQYARDLVKNEWILNGESIKLTKNGQLIDGQHRLQAIVNTGIAMKTYLVDDLDSNQSEKIFSTVDQGKTRTLSDILSCEKIKNSQRISSATISLKWIYSESKNLAHPYGNQKESRYDLLLYTKAHLNSLQKFDLIISKLYKQSKVANQSVCCAFSCYLYENGVDETIIEDFFSKLFLGFGGIKEAPNQLRVFISKNEIMKKSHNETYNRFYLTIAWNAFIKGSQFYPNLNKFENAERYPEILIKD